MSQYYYGHGQNQGQPPPQQPPYPYQQPQPLAGYVPPAYNAAPPYEQSYLPYTPGPVDGHYHVSQTSYDCNASRIPGLGITGTPTAPSSISYGAPPGISPWAVGHSIAQPINLPTGTPQHQNLAGSHSSPPSREPQSFTPQQHKPPIPPPTQTTQNKPEIANMEEGELSEGQFEDLYEPRDPPESAGEPPASKSKPLALPKTAPQTAPAKSPSVVEDIEPDLYGDDEEEGEITAENETANIVRARSGSYSPFLAASEVRNDNTQPATTANQTSQTTRGTNQDGQFDAPSFGQAPLPLPGLPGLGLHKGTVQTASSTHGLPAKPPTKATHGGDKRSLESLAQAKKEAQEAVLRLWPLGIQFQNYIDEGFEESVVKEIFKELNLNIATKPVTDAAETTPPSPKQPSADASKPTSNTQSQEKGSSGTVDKTGKPEARNERIARLLAEQQAKKAATAASGATKPPTFTVTKLKETTLPPSIPAKPKGLSDKNILLQKKMAALRELKGSRNTQSPKPQDDKNRAAPLSQLATMGNLGSKLSVGAQSSDSQIPTAEQSSSHTLQNDKTTAPGSQVDELISQVQSAQTRASPSASSSLLGLTSSAPQPPLTSGRKRPVAADFDDYSSTVGPLKRQYGHERIETSLVIDVSDGSDDEDMEMETDGDSPNDTPSAQLHKTPARNGPSIRDFPPLTDTSSKPFWSPGTSTSNGRTTKKKTELELKEAAIQQMRQRIAQAEAQAKQKVGKTSSGSQTPNQSATTPDSRDTESTFPPFRRAVSTNSAGAGATDVASAAGEASSSRLPKVSQLARLRERAKLERRGRIVSLDLPRVDSSLQEKMDRLKQLREEEARLQAEIDRSMAEKRVLTDELAQLDVGPLSSTSQLNGPEPANQPANSAPQTVDASSEGQRSLASGNMSSSSDGTSSGDVSMDTDSPRESSDAHNAAQRVPTSPDLGAITTEQDHVGLKATEALTKETNPEPRNHSSIGPETSQDGAMTKETEDNVDSHNIMGDDMVMESSAAEPSSSSESDGSQISDEDDMDLDSSSASAVGVVQGNFDIGEGDEQIANEQSSPSNQISSVTAPREAVQELEVEVSGEPSTGLIPPPTSAFVPYESPLSYFRAYRFHPDYQSTVPGGLKSLTYSNKIDPSLALCPYDLNNQQCPDGDECKFQHFRSILAPDDQILLELGKSDGYEDKNRFIQGLRELLQNFRANKIRDFGTIAQGIIDYRARFLGDKSKVLNLEGVVL